MSDGKGKFCELGVEVVPPISPVWERTLPYGYSDEAVNQFAVWGKHVVCLLRSSVVLLDPADGDIDGGSDVLPEAGNLVPLDMRHLVIGEGGEAYAWARFGETQISEWASGDPDQTDEWAMRQGYPKADWAVARFDIRSGNLLSTIPSPCTGFQSTNRIGRKGQFLKSDDGHLFDWHTGQWITAIPVGGAESDPPWRSTAGHTFEALRAGWIRISRKDGLDRFVKLPCGAFCVHSGTDYLIGGLNRRRLIAWRCMDLAEKGLEKLLS